MGGWFRALGKGVRLGHMGEGLIGPTLVPFGSPEQQQRFLPKIRTGDELWCQGYSEPDAGSDLANIQTRAERDGDRWRISGQKVWTSNAHWSDWCFVLARTDRDAPLHRGISFFLVPMDAPGIEIRPIVQITGTSEFNEVFFDGTPTDADLIVGAPGDGWRVAMGLLAFERGASTLGQQFGFTREFDEICALARRNGAIDDPILRQRIASTWARLQIQRWNSLRMLTTGVFDRYPSLQMMLGHGCEAIPFWIYRHNYMHQAGVRSQRYARLQPLQHDLFHYLRTNVLATNSGMAYEPAVKLLIEVMGEDRVMYAMDYPYQYVPDEVRWMDNMAITDEQEKKFFQTNAKRRSKP